MQISLDDWQKEVLETDGNICLRSGRQVGKSTVIAIKAAKYALENPNKTIMVISKVERQAQLLFQKILRNVHDIDKTQIKKGKDRPTKHLLNLKNGSVIHCLPAGDTGYGIMGYTIHLLIVDEAAFIPEEVWNSIIPSLAVSRGAIWLLSTPLAKKGYYYRCFKDPNFTSFHTSTEECPRRDDDFLARQKKWMTKAQYAQMYLGQFRDEMKQLFSDEVINNRCMLPDNIVVRQENSYYLGVDIARMGKDESTFEVIDGTDKKKLRHVESVITTETLTTDTTKKIIELDNKYHFKQIFIDDGGMGVGVFDQLLTTDQTKRKVIAINNESRPLTSDEKRSKKVMKENIFNNLLALMERKEIKLLDNDEVRASLKSIQYEYLEGGKMKIWGSYAHVADGLVRAAWCSQDKSLKPYIC